MTRHVAADLHFDLCRRLQTIERIKAGHFVDAMQRHAQPLRQRLQFLRRQVVKPLLDFVKCLDDHCGALRFHLRSGTAPDKNSSMLPGWDGTRFFAPIPANGSPPL